MTTHVHPQSIRDRFTAVVGELSELMPRMTAHNAALMVDAAHALERDRDRVVDPRDAEIGRLGIALRRIEFMASERATCVEDPWKRIAAIKNEARAALKGADND